MTRPARLLPYLHPDHRASGFAPRPPSRRSWRPSGVPTYVGVVGGLAAVFARVVGHVRRARVHRQKAQPARAGRRRVAGLRARRPHSPLWARRPHSPLQWGYSRSPPRRTSGKNAPRESRRRGKGFPRMGCENPDVHRDSHQPPVVEVGAPLSACHHLAFFSSRGSRYLSRTVRAVASGLCPGRCRAGALIPRSTAGTEPGRYGSDRHRLPRRPQRHQPVLPAATI